MLTALAADQRTTAHPGDLARSAQEAWPRTSTYDLVDQFSDLAHAADASARRSPRAA